MRASWSTATTTSTESAAWPSSRGVLGSLGARVVPFVPHRLKDGYDFGAAGLAAARDAGARLILTVDCGVLANEWIRRAGPGGNRRRRDRPSPPRPRVASRRGRGQSCAYRFDLPGAGAVRDGCRLEALLPARYALRPARGKPACPSRPRRLGHGGPTSCHSRERTVYSCATAYGPSRARTNRACSHSFA